MMTEKEMFDYVCKSESVFLDMATQLSVSGEVKEFLAENNDIDKYDLSLMMPKVSYDDWVVCLYEKDNKLYCIDETSIVEVKPVDILIYDDNFNVVKENGEMMSDEEIVGYCKDCSFAGEADDMRSYIYFG